MNGKKPPASTRSAKGPSEKSRVNQSREQKEGFIRPERVSKAEQKRRAYGVKRHKTEELSNPSDTKLEPPQAAAEGEKLQKVLARAGFGSRRHMESAIAEGRVQVNGSVATLGLRVDAKDRIKLDGVSVHQDSFTQSSRVLLYNKPEGEICSRNDPEGRRTVYERLPTLKAGRWISIGRLDYNTSGLLLFTTDGELANAMMHPSSGIDREYLVRVQGEVDEDILATVKNGVELEDGPARFTDVRAGRNEGSHHWYYCVVMEGRNREVRRIWESQNVAISRLKRVRYGNVFIPSHVRSGQYQELSQEELQDVYITAGIKPPRFDKKLNSRGNKTKQARLEKKLRSRGSQKRNANPKAPRPR